MTPRVVLDAMGGDLAPQEIVAGALMAAGGLDVDLTLVGRAAAITAELKGTTGLRSIHVVDAPDVIEMDEHATDSVRAKPDASINVGLRMVKSGAADAFVTAGNTGATMAAALLTLGRVRGIGRPALATVFPTQEDGQTIFLDVGANVTCRPEHYREFALMGHFYAQEVLGIARPKIKLAARVKIRKNGNVPAHEATGMILLGNGSVLVSGAVDHAWRQGVVLKLRSDGSLDRSFGDRGVSYLGAFQPAAIVRDQCGRVDAAGRYPSGGIGESGHAGLRILSRSGRNASGRVPRLPFGKSQVSNLTSITAAGGNGIVAAGWKDRVSTGKDVALVRLRAPGCR